MGKLGDENHGQKRRFDFFGHNFYTPPIPLAIIAGPSMGDENNCGEKIKNVGLIVFGQHFQTPSPITIIAGPPQIRDIESSSNIFGNLLIAISNSRVPRLRWEGGW